MTDQEADTGYIQLATAIIKLASYDYRNAKIGKTLDSAPNALLKPTWTLDEAVEDCRSFFLGSWFGTLSMADINGQTVLRMLDQDIHNGYRRKRAQSAH